MRFAVGLAVVAVGAILAFGVTTSSDAVNVQAIGAILILVGLAGLAIAQWLYATRRRTDVIYRDDGITVLEPNSPPPGGDPAERFRDPEMSETDRAEDAVDSLPPDRPALPAAPEIVPGARVVTDPRTAQPSRVDGVMNAEPGSAEFLRAQRDWL